MTQMGSFWLLWHAQLTGHIIYFNYRQETRHASLYCPYLKLIIITAGIVEYKNGEMLFSKFIESEVNKYSGEMCDWNWDWGIW